MRAEDSARSLFSSTSRPRLVLDQVSADIRNLEEYFLQAAARIPVQIEFNDTGILFDDTEEMESYTGPICQVVESVAWEPIGESWHLTYRKIRRLGVMTPMGGMDGPTFDQSDDLEHCPLADAPAQDRIRAHRALPELLQEAGSMFRG